MTRQRTIGVDRIVHLGWLDAAAAAVAEGGNDAQVRERLSRVLDGVLASGVERSAQSKTITVLCRIWATVPAVDVAFRNDALAVIPEVTAKERVAVHWAATMAAYPFFLGVATALGRLGELQGDVSLSHLRRRMTDTWGDRSTLPRAVQRVVRSMIEWGVVTDASTRGVYVPVARGIHVSGPVAALLLEGLLIGLGRPAVAADSLIEHPALFPFQVELSVRALARHPRFRLSRQGVSGDIVELA